MTSRRPYWYSKTMKRRPYLCSNKSCGTGTLSCVNISFVLINLHRCWPREWICSFHVHIRTIGHFRVPKTLTFKMRLGAQSFLWKWVLFTREWKMISISKAEHLTSFWNRGQGNSEMVYCSLDELNVVPLKKEASISFNLCKYVQTSGLKSKLISSTFWQWTSIKPLYPWASWWRLAAESVEDHPK